VSIESEEGQTGVLFDGTSLVYMSVMTIFRDLVSLRLCCFFVLQTSLSNVTGYGKLITYTRILFVLIVYTALTLHLSVLLCLRFLLSHSTTLLLFYCVSTTNNFLCFLITLKYFVILPIHSHYTLPHFIVNVSSPVVF
jgi:hypothetical protein